MSPLSQLDLPTIRGAVSDLYRIVEDPTPTNETVRRVFRWFTERSTLGEQEPTAETKCGALIQAGVDWVLAQLGGHSRGGCPEITDSRLDPKTQFALLKLRRALLEMCITSVHLSTDPYAQMEVLELLADTLACITPPEPARESQPALPSARDGMGCAHQHVETQSPPAHNGQSSSKSSGDSPARKRKGVPAEEAEVLVREWLKRHAKDDPGSVTRDQVAADTGVSTGQVSKTSAWKAFADQRKKLANTTIREIPLTDSMLAVIPSDCESTPELSELINEQEEDQAEEERRHKRRHRPS